LGAVLLAACNDLLGIRQYEREPATGGNGAGPSVPDPGGAGGDDGGSGGNLGGQAGGGELNSGVGGEPNSGAVAGTAGSNSASGSGGSGGSQIGMAGEAGAPASSGADGSGGTAGSQAGMAGAGATAGATGNPCGFVPNYFTFETSSTEGFEITYFEPQLLRNSSSIASENGSLVLRVGFDGEQQEFDVASMFEDPIDLRGKVISACVRLIQNVDDSPQLPAIELFASSGENQNEGYSFEKRFADTDWFELELLTDLPSRQDGPYDAGATSSIGFVVWTDFGYYGGVVIEIEGISIE
jgi:hypothetical protein